MRRTLVNQNPPLQKRNKDGGTSSRPKDNNVAREVTSWTHSHAPCTGAASGQHGDMAAACKRLVSQPSCGAQGWRPPCLPPRQHSCMFPAPPSSRRAPLVRLRPMPLVSANPRPLRPRGILTGASSWRLPLRNHHGVHEVFSRWRFCGFGCDDRWM